PHFLPWFAARGYAAHALSLRGHGRSGGQETMFVAGLDDFAVDVARIASGLPSPPVLIGHSMGAAIVERLLVSGPVRAAALLAPGPPRGPPGGRRRRPGRCARGARTWWGAGGRGKRGRRRCGRGWRKVSLPRGGVERKRFGAGAPGGGTRVWTLVAF